MKSQRALNAVLFILSQARTATMWCEKQREWLSIKMKI